MFTGKKVLVYGMGSFGGGIDSILFVAKSAEKVVITDKGNEKKLAASIKKIKDLPNIELHLGGHDINDFRTANIVIVNPAINPENNEFLNAAEQAGAKITSQIELFFANCPAKIIGITGSNGKSTTGTLTAHLLANATGNNLGNVILSGNIGNRPLLQELENISPNDIVVLELSSFQLEQLANIKKSPHISCITNLAPNHLDRHKTMANYAAAKENIIKFQKCNDFAVLNSADDYCKDLLQKYKSKLSRCVLFDTKNLAPSLTDVYKLNGEANRQNLAAAVEIAHLLGLSDTQLTEAVGSFVALPHRLELIGTVEGVGYYNDSISTTPESTVVAVEAFAEPKILIAGGYDKNLPFDTMAEKISGRLKALILIGNTAEKIETAIRKFDSQVPIYFEKTLADAVGRAKLLAENGDAVLLSPACASYDMFKNFADRGRQFTELVREI